MGKLSAQTLALIVSAIKNMRESKGSSSRDILNYISSVHDIPKDVGKRQMVAALKRGVAHGIIKKSEGYYSLPTDTESECLEVAAQELGLLDLACRKKKREARKKQGRRNKGCSKRRKRSRRKARGCGSRKRRSKRKCGCKSKSRKARRSKRGRSGCKPKRRSRSSRKNKCDMNVLENEGKEQCRSGQLNIDGFDNDRRQLLGTRTSRTRSRDRSKSCTRNGNVVPTA